MQSPAVLRCILILLSLTAAMSAQTPTGTVTGLVLAQDTQRPVRFADVQLDPVSTSEGRNRGGGIARVRTEVDGTFSAANVPAGDYYVTAFATGYMSERELLLMKVNAGADPAQLLNTIPQVHVSANGASNATVTLERGATISGRLLWEDNSPATGLPVSATHTGQKITQLPAPLPQLPQFGAIAFTQTDDRGIFRITGLAGGDYLVTTAVHSQQIGGGNQFTRGRQNEASITFYAPGVFHAGAAHVFTVRPGDERNDIRMTLDMRGLHTVSGVANSDNAGLTVASGSVTLTDASDSNLHLRGNIGADGRFFVRFVPPGSYTLQVSGASTQANEGFRGRDSNSTPATQFQPYSGSVTVTDSDLTGVPLSLTPVAPSNGR